MHIGVIEEITVIRQASLKIAAILQLD